MLVTEEGTKKSQAAIQGTVQEKEGEWHSISPSKRGKQSEMNRGEIKTVEAIDVSIADSGSYR